ncbi:ABC transporter substrate-binding protein [uncultured Selenomonas sp.]|uniref:ABC transporter substrate-binding protein n=1 Tax=uncultured Selenomonas sp. TaxID=159275 RepID=UPI00258E72C5|nr:ABC transporter substrate-binding protein [uncultured Selenomonas sp.]
MNTVCRMMYLLLAVLPLLFAFGCGKASAPQASGYTVTDAQGRAVAFEKKPVRILSYGLWLDNIVLGMLPPERLVGIDHMADDPNSSNIVGIAEGIAEKINHPSAERVLALHPDVVFLDADIDAGPAQTLPELGIRVVACKKPHNAEELRAAVRMVAAALGEEEKGEALVGLFDAEREALAGRLREVPQEARKTVVVISMSPTYGSRGGLFDGLCGMAGVTNGAAQIGLTAGQALTKEYIVAVNPDVLIVPVWNDHGSYDIEKFNREYLGDPALQTVRAIRDRRIARPHEGYIYNASQDMIFGAQDIAHAAYGDIVPLPVHRHLSVVEGLAR